MNEKSEKGMEGKGKEKRRNWRIQCLACCKDYHDYRQVSTFPKHFFISKFSGDELWACLQVSSFCLKINGKFNTLIIIASQKCVKTNLRKQLTFIYISGQPEGGGHSTLEVTGKLRQQLETSIYRWEIFLQKMVIIQWEDQKTKGSNGEEPNKLSLL